MHLKLNGKKINNFILNSIKNISSNLYIVDSYSKDKTLVIAKKNKEIGERMRGFRGGMKSLTHKGDLDFTTKKGDKVFHRDGHNVAMPFRPYKKMGRVMRK